MDLLGQPLGETPGVAFAALIGSRNNHTAGDGSDWDIAILWKSADSPGDSLAATPANASFARLGEHEALRRRLALCLNVAVEKIDLIDLNSARLAMKAVVVEEGTIVSLKDELAWARFQTATWRELEDHYWDLAHAA
ncbi:MAG: nucleotidyltransferase domain-containing protein [Betaproteobacteria bacterium]|nr:nucleotidyltransferase domain-containing protein [Betaproteobacteria bacterium]